MKAYASGVQTVVQAGAGLPVWGRLRCARDQSFPWYLRQVPKPCSWEAVTYCCIIPIHCSQSHSTGLLWNQKDGGALRPQTPPGGWWRWGCLLCLAGNRAPAVRPAQGPLLWPGPSCIWWGQKGPLGVTCCLQVLQIRNYLCSCGGQSWHFLGDAKSQRQGSPLLCKVCFDVIPLNDLSRSTELERHLCIRWKKQSDLLNNKAITQHFPWNVIVLHTYKRYTSLLGNKQGLSRIIPNMEIKNVLTSWMPY